MLENTIFNSSKICNDWIAISKPLMGWPSYWRKMSPWSGLQSIDSNATSSLIRSNCPTAYSKRCPGRDSGTRGKVYDCNDSIESSVFNLLINCRINIAHFPFNFRNCVQYIEFCTSGTSVVPIESEFQLVYNYYKDVRSALLKGYILTQFSLMLLAVKNLGQYIYEIRIFVLRM